MHNKSNFNGLKNQGSTCYLNSLIQTLFMTPEFRNAVYSWKSPSVKNDQCLLLQMQKLFLRLQIGEDGAVDTEHFTKSLGSFWEFKPWEQCDAHELLRCIFDTLEQIWQEKGTVGQLSPMQKFYRGKMDSYVKCTKCGKEEVTIESFLDIPLAIRNFDSSDSFKNIEESISAYLELQYLEGEYCEHCHQGDGLQMQTGFRITEFPRILTLHLKRFDVDRQTKQRYKLNDRIEFDDFLDLNKYIHKKAERWSEYNNYMEVDDCSSSALREHVNETQPTKEDYVYDLFAVIVHGGSCSSGHYMAYIKSLIDVEDRQWLCFNDSTVRPVTFEDVQKTFGTDVRQQKQYSGASTSSFWPKFEYNDYGTNAYVLMYRKDYDGKAEPFKPISEFPISMLLSRKLRMRRNGSGINS